MSELCVTVNCASKFQYLEENIHQTYIDVGVMARHLQEKYREYGRRKQQPFRFLVDQGTEMCFTLSFVS